MTLECNKSHDICWNWQDGDEMMQDDRDLSWGYTHSPQLLCTLPETRLDWIVSEPCGDSRLPISVSCLSLRCPKRHTLHPISYKWVVWVWSFSCKIPSFKRERIIHSSGRFTFTAFSLGVVTLKKTLRQNRDRRNNNLRLIWLKVIGFLQKTQFRKYSNFFICMTRGWRKLLFLVQECDF